MGDSPKRETVFMERLDRISGIATLLLVLGVAATLTVDLTRGRPAPQTSGYVAGDVSIELDGMPYLGSPTAEFVVVEFSDYECPFCRRHATGVLRELIASLVASGEIGYAFANSPLPSHANATDLAKAAICAGEQDRYWEMHDALFMEGVRTKAGAFRSADELGLEQTEFRRCFEESEKPALRIELDMRAARSIGVTGTPSFAIGRRIGGDTMTVERVIVGSHPYGVFVRAIDDLK